MRFKKWMNWALLLPMLLGGAELFAQTENEDCGDDPWSSPQVHDFTLTGGCSLRVTYTTRFACRTWQDLQILEVSPLAPVHISCESYAAMHPKVLLAHVVQEIVISNPMDFSIEPRFWSPPTLPDEPILPENCHTEWRVWLGSCWDYGIGVWPLRPCAGVSKCSRQFVICREPEGGFTATPMSSTFGATACPNTYSPPTFCRPVCD